MRHARTSRRRRRGSVYVAVLGTSLLVAVIGLGALAVAGTRTRITMAETAMVDAREAAMAGLESATATLAASGTWRDDLSEGEWVADVATGRGSFTVRLDDPTDDDLSDDASDPLDILVTGTSGPATQRLAATMYFGASAPALEPQLLLDGSLAVGGSNVVGSGLIRAVGAVTSSGSTIGHDVTSGDSISGSEILGVQTIDPTKIALPTAAAMIGQWNDRRADIIPGELTVGGTNLLVDGSFESGLSGWSSSDGVASIRRSVNSVVDGGWSQFVGGRSSEHEGTRLDLTSLIRSGVLPRITARIRTECDADRVQYQLSIVWVKGGKTTIDAGPVVTGDGDWMDVEVTSTIDTPTLLSSVMLMISTIGTTCDYALDDVRVMDTREVGTPWVLERVAIGPKVNPRGATSGSGIYRLDVGGRNLVIRDCRIVGTVCIVNVGPEVRIEGSVSWRPVVAGDPIILLDGGTLVIATDEDPLCEVTVGRQMDSVELPYPYPGGTASGALDAVIPSRLEGIIVVDGDVVFENAPRIAGTVIAGGNGTINAAHLVLEAGDVDPGRVVLGIAPGPTRVAIESGSLVRVLTP